ncbi:hypothetical protein P3X46_008922 [Hevea brasiliensis]|uniref:ABC transporter domain-containing protein n=1 Tax=Hevea brasiliensis TaxID=3981 RepID=A0ABQ9MK68_HEVBR|nr:hypothetical protein P3X46_008922 [Hevea brasiliensis]
MGVLEHQEPTIEINGLKFTYPGIDGHPPPGSKPLIDDFSLTLKSGDRCLLVGSMALVRITFSEFLTVSSEDIDYKKGFNFCFWVKIRLGKTTILKILGGSTCFSFVVEVRCCFAGLEVPIQIDVSTKKMIFGLVGIGPQRKAELIKVLDIDLSWRMHKVSDGQRRRVQICMGLLRPFKVLLLDEITVDLDVLARADLLKFLRKECEERGATIIYATHIFDGLEEWPTHIVYVAHGKLQLAMPMAKVKEISNLSLMRTVESWLRKERDEERRRRKERKASGLPEFQKQMEGSRVTGDPSSAAVHAMNNGWAAGRLHSTIAGEENFFLSSNRVLRQ